MFHAPISNKYLLDIPTV